MKSPLGFGRILVSAALLAGFAIGGCSASSSLGETAGAGGETGAGGAGGESSGGGEGGKSSGGGEGGLGAGGSFTTGQGGAAAGEIYVHDDDTLYKLEPIALELTLVGTFDCVLADPSGSADSGMHDIALDKDGQMFGVAKMGGQSAGTFQDHVIVSIDKATGNCNKEVVIPQHIIDPNELAEVRGLSFVPAGTIDSTAETLVALEIYGAYLKIDLASKSVSVQGNLNGNGPVVWNTKGADIVSIINDKTYVTAKKAGESEERLAIMDPVTGEITQGFMSSGLFTFGGLAYWGGTLYAFTHEGGAYSLDPATGEATEIVLKGASGVEFQGAGVTTSAPVTIPK